MMLLIVTGRTGRTLTVHVGRHAAADGTLLLSAAGAWRHNLRGGAEVRLILDGRERTASAMLEPARDRAAERFKELVDRGVARAIAPKVNVDRPPSVEEMKAAVAGRELGYLRAGSCHAV